MGGANVWLGIPACIGLLALALLCLQRVARSALALPLALLCFDLVVWNAAAAAFDATFDLRWRWLDVSASPLTAPLAVDFVLAFVGLRRRLRGVRAAGWIFFGSISLASALAFVWSPAREFAGSHLWAALHLGGLVPAMAFAVVLLVRHLGSSADPVERARTRLLLAAMAVGALGGISEMLDNLYPWIPALGALSMLAAGALVALVVLRLRLFDDEISLDAAALAVMLACAAVAAQLCVQRFAGANGALLSLATAAVALAVAAAARRLAIKGAKRRARMEQLATLGRFSAELAHDLKNPLAALQGAAQFLERELTVKSQGAPDPREFVRLMLDQIQRLEEIVERYQRLSQVQPTRAPISLNQVVREVLALQAFASGGRVSVRAELAEPLPVCNADRDLLAGALENLIRNAFEAMPDGGEVTVRTRQAAGAILLSVEDSGPGMDARTRERAFDDFFTTRKNGSGLGLAFVRRVTEAHGGEASLSARAGHGTVVNLRLPLDEDAWPKSAQPS